MKYTRNDLELERSTFRARGDILEIMPAFENSPLNNIKNFIGY